MTTAKLLLLLDEQDRKLNSTASTTNLNGVHVSLDSPEVPGTPRIMEHNNSSGSHGNGMNEDVLTLEDMQQFQSSNPFGFIMDVLEGEGGDESEALHPLPNDAYVTQHQWEWTQPSRESIRQPASQRELFQLAHTERTPRSTSISVNRIFQPCTATQQHHLLHLSQALRRAIQTGPQPYLLRAVYPEGYQRMNVQSVDNT
ncbi:hypothetical protein SELMODRAFT_429241 [Selaginella moellendorffii]|uniref:Uncharacterized protein n=1 Tax=Selaginella moellendorffii TaxID=88036 RepID=D8T5I5_SELML|nr:hypothetical protein SELMODRAFT_429241 [Selaginella moellendorffii]